MAKPLPPPPTYLVAGPLRKASLRKYIRLSFNRRPDYRLLDNKSIFVTGKNTKEYLQYSMDHAGLLTGADNVEVFVDRAALIWEFFLCAEEKNPS